MLEKKNSLIHFILDTVPIPKSEAEEIANTFHPIQLKKGDFLLRGNHINNDYFYLEKGLMRTFLFDLKGNEITTDFFIENNIVFEVTSFFNRVHSETNIQAITDCSGFRISYDELNTLFHNKPAFRDFGRAILVKEFITSKKRNYGMINRTAEERYQNLLSSKSQIIQQAPLKYIASYLGITDSTLSRLRRKI
ncbi:Crp/Fnr family transcriptional regulator [Flavivirga amylovorans]|uniref:Crp/Fnr family transcriptional regulator n=1 Tax=Flavivirga amylovorans TaxID=870486 RepID=A0ABT8X6R2_9FLAO|nr:Crp/Fnr family transcriptional regulator [Flavivirga amylovorans]MDO5989627.1 Crp/Fnr family transcriptional regulator [Flavivirga amylovorans]